MCVKVIFNFLSRNMAFRLNQNQNIAAIRHYYQCGSNATEASRRLSEEFNIHAVQGRNIKSLVNKFEITGSMPTILFWNYAIRFVTVLLHDWFSVLNTAGNNLNSLNDLFEHCCNLTSFLLIILLSLFINSSYCACSSHLSYNKIYLNLQLLLI